MLFRSTLTIPSWPAPTGLPVSGSDIRIQTPGTGNPIEPTMFPAIFPLGAKKSGLLMDVTGESSVQPYPSKGRIPNLDSNSLDKDGGSFSAPQISSLSVSKSPGSDFFKQNLRKVAVER